MLLHQDLEDKKNAGAKRHVVLVIGDGMADLPLPELNGKTPLEAANPINMHRLTANGASGLLDPIAPGIAPGTEAAHLSILGYDPQMASIGRGPFEAAGTGIKLQNDDVAFRCNFVTITDDLAVIDERAGRIGAEAAELAAVLQSIQLKRNSDVQIIFRQSLGFKGALVLRGDKLSANVSAPMPKTGDKAGTITPLDESIEAKRTAESLNEFTQITHNLLKNHPINIKRVSESKPAANAVIPWSGSKVPLLEPFSHKYGLKAACVAAASVIKGIGKLCGMTVIDVAGATGELDTDTLAKADATLQALKHYNFVLVHVEAADEASHDGNIQGKIAVIKKIDAMIGKILDGVDFVDTAVMLLSDHVTSTQQRMHTGDPVPIAVASVNVVKDGIAIYSETAAAEGSLCRIQGKDIMPLIMNLFDHP